MFWQGGYHPFTPFRIPYLALAKTFEGIEGTSSRLEITKILATFLASAIELSPQDVAPSVYRESPPPLPSPFTV